jgi:hypothetical protein
VNLRAISLPQTLVEIGSHSFFECHGLESIAFSAGSHLRVIEEFAFSGCSELTVIDFPDQLRVIGPHAFSYCSGLERVRFPEGLERLGSCSFQRCLKLESIVIPDGLTAVEHHAFSGGVSVKALLFGDLSRVVRIGSAAFASLHNLTEVVLPDSLSILAGFAFSGCISLERVVLPSKLTQIQDHAFWQCKSLGGWLTILRSVTSVDVRAFGKTKLQSIVISNCRIKMSRDSMPSSLRRVVAPKRCRRHFGNLSSFVHPDGSLHFNLRSASGVILMAMVIGLVVISRKVRRKRDFAAKQGHRQIAAKQNEFF